MNELALFAGAGGGLLGSRLLGWRTVCAVENDPYRQAVLLARQEDGQLDSFPIWSDVRDFDGFAWRGIVDIVTAGFPCQPFSVAGRQRGADDERNLWPDTIRVIREVGPRYALLENVPGLAAHDYFGTILGDLAESGYRVRWDCILASAVGANHQRDRLWIVADANQACECRLSSRAKQKHASVGERRADVADARANRRRLFGDEGRDGAAMAGLKAGDACNGNEGKNWWATEPDVGRVADGVAARVDRLAALGDGQVPAVVRAAWVLLSSK